MIEFVVDSSVKVEFVDSSCKDRVVGNQKTCCGSSPSCLKKIDWCYCGLSLGRLTCLSTYLFEEDFVSAGDRFVVDYLLVIEDCFRRRTSHCSLSLSLSRI